MVRRADATHVTEPKSLVQSCVLFPAVSPSLELIVKFHRPRISIRLSDGRIECTSATSEGSGGAESFSYLGNAWSNFDCN